MIHIDFDTKRRTNGGIGACGAFADVTYPPQGFREALLPHRGCPHYMCKRCLASLAKRDRAFQRKARRRFSRRATLAAMAPRTRRAYASDRWRDPALRAASAIAREEGRAL